MNGTVVNISVCVFLLNTVIVQAGNVSSQSPPNLMHLNTWSPAGADTSGGCEIYMESRWRKWVTRDRETGGWLPFLVLTQALYFLICQHMNRTVCKPLPPRAEPLGQPRLPCHDGFYPWKLWAKINHSSLELLLLGYFGQWEEKSPIHIHTQERDCWRIKCFQLLRCLIGFRVECQLVFLLMVIDSCSTLF